MGWHTFKLTPGLTRCGMIVRPSLFLGDFSFISFPVTPRVLEILRQILTDVVARDMGASTKSGSEVDRRILPSKVKLCNYQVFRRRIATCGNLQARIQGKLLHRR